jgi:hypothetical protein
MNDIATELARIAAESDGQLIPARVVDAARDPASPLHDKFEWDDSKAAEAHRLNQARTLIRSVKMVVETNQRIITAPAFVRDPTHAARDGGYVHTLSLRSDEDLAREAVIAEFQRASAALKRARDIAAVLGIVDDIDTVTASLAGLIEQTAHAA